MVSFFLVYLYCGRERVDMVVVCAEMSSGYGWGPDICHVMKYNSCQQSYIYSFYKTTLFLPFFL